MSINKNENTNAENNAIQSKQTKEFLEKIASPEWIREKKRFILERWEEHLEDDRGKKTKFLSLVNEAKNAKGFQNLDEFEKEKAEIEIKVKVMEEFFSKEEVVEDNDLKYKMYFDMDKPGELIKKFANLEEENLALINAQQENEETYNEEQAKFTIMLTKKQHLIDQANQRKALLSEQEKDLQEKVKIMKELCSQKKKASNEISFEKIEATVYTLLREFKDEKELKVGELGQINKGEMKNKENILKYLKAIERLLIEQITVLSQDKSRMDEIKKMKTNLNKGKTNIDEELKKKEEEQRKFKEKQETRLKELRRRKGRKDMFKYSFPDKQDEAEENNNDEEALEFQKYFMD